MPDYAIIRVNKCKLGAVGRLEAHHEREKTEYKSNPDIDQSKSHLNYHLVQPQGKYRQVVLNRIQTAGAKRRRDSVVMQDGLITATPEWIKGKSEDEQIAFFNYAYAFCEQRYGKENMVSAVVHLDEATPHMHFSFVPITQKNHLSSKTVMGGSKGMVKLQDDFYEYMAQRYPELERGKPQKVTQRKHIPSYLFKAGNELYRHYEEICAAIQSIGVIGNAKKKEEAIALITRYAPEMAQVKSQLSITDSYIHSLEKEKAQAEKIAAEAQKKADRQVRQARQETANVKNIANTNEMIAEDNLKASKERLMKAYGDISSLRTKLGELQALVDLLPPEMLEELRKQEYRNRRQAHNHER